MKFVNIYIIVQFASSSFCFVSTPKIAIIGGGIGGTSCAYFLRSLFGDNLLLDLYEAEDIGGRLSVVSFGGRKYEVGGSIIHSRNKYMSDFRHILDLKKREKSTYSYFGLYNGNDFVFEESQWQIITLIKLIKRYHLGFWKLRNHINHMLDDFEKIYKYQQDGFTYNNVSALLSAMDPKFVEYLKISSRKGFLDEGFSENVVDELVMATLKTNYGQDMRAHKFVGSVSVAGGSGSLWAFDGGNAQVPEKLLKLSKARLIHSPVKRIRRLSTNKMKVIVNVDSENADQDQVYNMVIVATPQTSDMKHRIFFENFEKQIVFPGRYHQTVCTLIKGRLRNDYFQNKNSFIDAILSISDSVFFNSIGRINPVDYKKKNYDNSDVWKIFSQRLLTEDELNSLFSDISDKYVKVWLAYPEYDAFARNDTFVLDNNLYHISAIDWAASSMEMSVIGAKNVALLAFKSWSVSVADNSENLVENYKRENNYKVTDEL